MNILQEEKDYNDDHKDSYLDIKHKSDSNDNFENSINGKEMDVKQSNEKIFIEKQNENNTSDFSYSDDKNNDNKKNIQILKNLTLKINPNITNNHNVKKSVKINFNTIDTLDPFQNNEDVKNVASKNLTGSIANIKDDEENQKEHINKNNNDHIYIDDPNITRNFGVHEIEDNSSQFRIILNKIYYSSNCVVYYIIIVILTVLSVLYSILTHIKKYNESPSIIFDIFLLSIMTIDVVFKIYLKVSFIHL